MITQTQIAALCAEIEALPAGARQTKVSVMAAALFNQAAPDAPAAPAPVVSLAQLQAMDAAILRIPASPQKTDLVAAYKALALTYEGEEESGAVAVAAPPRIAD